MTFERFLHFITKVVLFYQISSYSTYLIYIYIIFLTSLISEISFTLDKWLMIKPIPFNKKKFNMTSSLLKDSKKCIFFKFIEYFEQIYDWMFQYEATVTNGSE